jgi:hypothetical protein
MVRNIRVALLASALCLCMPAAAHAGPPVCQGASFTILPGAVLHLPAPRCDDPEQQTYALSNYSDPPHGTVDPLTATYTPDAGFHGFDAFNYQVKDTANEESVAATVEILVDNAPVCSPISVTVPANVGTALPEPSCSDPDGDDYDFLIDDPAHGVFSFPPDNSLVYTPTAGYVGPDSFIFNARDDFDLLSADTVMSIAVVAPPPVPTVKPTPPPAPKDVTAPVITLKNASKKQSVAIALTTNENCAATLTLTLDKATAKKLKLGRTVGQIKAALTPGTDTIQIKLSTKARKAFKKLKRVKLTLTAVVMDSVGNSVTKTLAVTLKK